MITTNAISDSTQRERLLAVFGSDNDTMEAVATRAAAAFAGTPVIAWEGDAQTFQFSFVSPEAEHVLGYPCHRWIREPAFWADTVVHPHDRTDAIAFCALATGRCQDHDFVYRATAADGKTIWLHDIVKVLVSARGIPSKLRGIMIPIDPDRTPARTA